MSRRRKTQLPMNVLFNGRQVGFLRMERSGAVSFVYDESWIHWEHALPISLSLPLQEQPHVGAVVISYLDNLLPDNQLIRDRIAAKVSAEGTDAYSMLSKLGRDCVGALQFVAQTENMEDHKPGEITAEPVTDSEISAILNHYRLASVGLAMWFSRY